jgi:hypothetical protein
MELYSTRTKNLTSLGLAMPGYSILQLGYVLIVSNKIALKINVVGKKIIIKYLTII